LDKDQAELKGKMAIIKLYRLPITQIMILAIFQIRLGNKFNFKSYKLKIVRFRQGSRVEKEEMMTHKFLVIRDHPVLD
jgi:hypothetical protein